MKIKCFLFAILIMTLSGCNVVKELGGAYNMTQCKYEYNSISRLTIAGMDLTNGISLTHIPRITTLFTGQPSSIPLSFNLNLNVTNPNQTTALLHGLQYILSIDNVQFTTGSVSQALNIPAGGNQVLPLNIGLDLATLLTGDSKNAVVNIAKNFIGINDQASNVTLQIKPTFMVGGIPITTPQFIPVNFAFNGIKRK